MNYDRIYTSIIQNRKNNPVTGYTENHHVLPKCIFPQYSNLRQHIWNSVKLTAREHFICHQLLTKIYPHHFGLGSAAFLMSAYKTHGSKKYAWLREKHSTHMKNRIVSKETKEKQSKMRKGSNNCAGRTYSDETKKKMSDSQKGIGFEERYGTEDAKRRKEHISLANKGKVRTEEFIIAQSKRMKNFKHSDETKIKISLNHHDISGEKNPMYGKIHSEETRKKMSEAAKRRVRK